MASYPYARVAHLTGLELAPWMVPSWRDPVTKTPTTLHGGEHGIYSYGLLIARKTPEGWYVHARNSSPTTNRHIDAAARVIEANGFKPTGTFEQETGEYMQLYARKEG